MLLKNITHQEIINLIGHDAFVVWSQLCTKIDKLYDMEQLWNSGGKKWIYEYKYRRGGKTLCALYAKANEAGLMIIFGKKEREKFAEIRDQLTLNVQAIYDEAQIFHDGKWVMFPLDQNLLDDIEKLLIIKRKPNRK